MKGPILAILSVFACLISLGQGGGTADHRIEHKVWSDGNSVIIIDGREARKSRKGLNPTRIVHAGDYIEIIGRPDSSNRVHFGVFYDRVWVYRIDTVMTTNLVWSYRVEEDPKYKTKNPEYLGKLVLGALLFAK